jgi:beta-galactosidase
MLYKIYAACWTPYSVRPVVYLAHHWNRSGGVTVNAFSNCPMVRLLINGVKQGTDQTPYPDSGTGTARMAHQGSWNVTWQSGTVTAQGLDENGNVVCTDQKVTAGNPDHILLTVAAPIVNPATGDTFRITANGSDAAFILATVVDANGNWCPTASNNVTFSVSGPGKYRGGADQMIGGGGANYHSPGDPELTAEGGMCKVVVRSTFTPGVVTVNAASGSLKGTASFTVYPVPAPPPVSVRAPLYPAGRMTAASVRIGTAGGTIRYFINQPASVSLELLDAGGKTVMRAPASRQEAGWHHVRPATPGGEAAITNGVYFVRCALDGQSFVKRVLVVR